MGAGEMSIIDSATCDLRFAQPFEDRHYNSYVLIFQGMIIQSV